MSGQKYRRTNFDDDENTSTAGTPPGVTYDPSIAFKVKFCFYAEAKKILLYMYLAILGVKFISRSK